MIIKPKHVALIITDGQFIQTGLDVNLYLKKLFRFIHMKEEGKEIEIMTISGKYGVGSGLSTLDVDDKNKSVFANIIVDRINFFNEIIFISNYKKEPYLYHLRSKLQEQEIPTSVFNYQLSSQQEQDNR